MPDDDLPQEYDDRNYDGECIECGAINCCADLPCGNCEKCLGTVRDLNV